MSKAIRGAHLAMAFAMLAGMGGTVPDFIYEPPPPPPPPKPRMSPSEVACPRCKAAVNMPCDRRTLGRHLHHLARVQAAAAAEENEP